MTYTLLLSLHLLAASLWVGGMACMHLAVRPAAVARLEPPLRLPFMTEALGRFFAWVTGAIGVLLATGLAMIAMNGGFAATHWRVHAMFAIALLMMAIFAHLRVVPYRRLRAAVADSHWPQAAQHLASVRRLVSVNLVLGVVVYVVAVLGRTL